jgi:ribosomal protein S18 acetylase RimI-like enzyme
VIRRQDVVVAEEEGRVVGFVAMTHGDSDHAATDGDDMVAHLYVHPERHRLGIGSALLDEAKRRLPRGFRLWVFQQNHPARRFYERHGLAVVRLTDGSGNEEKTPDALYEWPGTTSPVA